MPDVTAIATSNQTSIERRILYIVLFPSPRLPTRCVHRELGVAIERIAVAILHSRRDTLGHLTHAAYRSQPIQ
jgi:hypothetical protein